MLLNAGADVDLTDNPPETALRLAAAFGYPEVVDLLVAAGARPQSAIEVAAIGGMTSSDIEPLGDFDRACALRAAAVNDRLETIDLLLDAGVPIDAEVDGKPAIYWAREQGRERAVQHLEARAG